MPPPLVTIAIPTCNRPELLRRAVRSVLASTLQDFEICISDDGEPKLGGEWIRQFDDPRIRYAPHPRCGVEHNWTAACEMGSAPFVMKLDDDDEILPRFLETTIAFLRANPAASVVYAAQETILPGGKLIPVIDRGFWRNRTLVEGYDYARALLLNEGYPVNHKSAGVFRREAAAAVDWFRVARLDVTFSISIALGHKVGYIPQLLFRYYMHGGSSEGMGVPTYDRLLEQINELFTWNFVRRHPDFLALEPLVRQRMGFLIPLMYLSHAIQKDPWPEFLEKVRVTRRRVPGLGPWWLMWLILAAVKPLPRPCFTELVSWYARSRWIKNLLNWMIAVGRSRKP